ncbi:MAG: hypothetical protein SWH78_12705 [Thermodesulfobacteriota bacterium]|nr:hypothetical protein [Thermodesulfobacteriota bacterium]
MRRTCTKVLRICGVWMGVCLLLLACSHSDSSLPFDPNIKDMEMVQWITGEEAQKAIDRLHGMSIDVVRGFIAHYKGAYGKATIWVSEATTEDLASEQIDVMIDKMKKSKRSPFSNYRQWNKEGLNVIAFDGMGQVHYVFKDKTWVYWVSADGRGIDTILEHIQDG